MEYMPIYVKIQEPESIQSLTFLLRDTMNDTRNTLERLKSLTDEEAKKLAEWKVLFEGLNSKLSEISSRLLMPERI